MSKFLGEYQSFEKLTQGLLKSWHKVFFLLEKQSVVYPIKYDWDDETYCAKWGMWIEHLDFVFFLTKNGSKKKILPEA